MPERETQESKTTITRIGDDDVVRVSEAFERMCDLVRQILQERGRAILIDPETTAWVVEELHRFPHGERYTRQSKRQLSPEIELIEKGLQVAGSPERLIEWMQTPIPSLAGQTPYSLLGTEQGREQVEAVLGRIEHSVY